MSKIDQVVLDRRLKPIYDALDAQNTKKALQEAEKVLKKHPLTDCAKVLKALCLIRSEKLGDGMAILNAMDVDGARHDDNTLQAFAHCYREASLPGRIATMYERQCASDPTEHNLTQLFMSYARVKEYKKQQATALRLFKEFKNPPYYFWAVMSIVMQAIENPDLAEKMLYPLAEKMCKTQIEKSGYTEGSPAEIELQLLIAEGLKKYTDCLLVLDEPHIDSVSTAPIFLYEKRAGYLKTLKRCDTLRDISELELEKLPDNWTMWNYRFDSAIGLIQKGIENKDEEKIKSSYNALIEFLEKQIGKPADKPCRGPFMARLQLIKRLKETPELEGRIDISVLGEPEALIFDYIEKFFTKPSCYNDMQMFFSLLDDDRKLILLKSLDLWIEGISKEDEEKYGVENKVWAIIVYERVRKVFGVWDTQDEEKLRRQLTQFIAQIIQPGISELSQGFLCQLAIAPLWDAWRKEDDLEKFYEMILLLEYVAVNNQVDPVCKLALIRAYTHIGNTSRVTALVKALDVKSVQNDTLGYLQFPIFELAGRFNLAIIANTQLSTIYDSAEKEIGECLVNAYKNGKFGQVPRVSALSEQMRKSAQATGCDVLNRYLSALFVIDNFDEAINTFYGEEEPIEWGTLVDNRDLNIIPPMEGSNYAAIVEDMKARTFKEFIDISKMRSIVARAIAVVGRTARDDVNQKIAKMELELEGKELVIHLETCLKEYATFDIASRLQQSPAPMCFSQWIHSGGLQIFRRLFEAAVKITKLIDDEKPIENSVLGGVQQLSDELKKVVDVYSPERKPTARFWIREPILAASRALQTLASCQLLLKAVEKCMVKEWKFQLKESKAGSRGKKAVTKSPVVPGYLQHVRALIAEVNKSAKLLNEKLALLMPEAGADDLVPSVVGEDLGSMRLVLETNRPVVDSRIRRSYVMAIEDMQTTIAARF